MLLNGASRDHCHLTVNTVTYVIETWSVNRISKSCSVPVHDQHDWLWSQRMWNKEACLVWYWLLCPCRRFLPSYAYGDLVRNSLDNDAKLANGWDFPVYNVAVDVDAELSRMAASRYESSYAFQSDIAGLFTKFYDGHTGYTVFNNTGVYVAYGLPFTYGSALVNGVQRITVDRFLPVISDMYYKVHRTRPQVDFERVTSQFPHKYQSNPPSRSLVKTINGMDALEYVKVWYRRFCESLRWQRPLIMIMQFYGDDRLLRCMHYLIRPRLSPHTSVVPANCKIWCRRHLLRNRPLLCPETGISSVDQVSRANVQTFRVSKGANLLAWCANQFNQTKKTRLPVLMES